MNLKRNASPKRKKTTYRSQKDGHRLLEKNRRRKLHEKRSTKGELARIRHLRKRVSVRGGAIRRNPGEKGES